MDKFSNSNCSGMSSGTNQGKYKKKGTMPIYKS